MQDLDGRSVLVDNARGLLILLVVLGHAIEVVVPAFLPARVLFGGIYAFHMPAFVMISAFFVRPLTATHEIAPLIGRWLVPFLVCDLFFFGFLHLAAPGRLLGPLVPAWHLWFLPALVFWTLLLPLFLRIRHPLPVALLLAIACGAADWIDDRFALSRTLVFFPAFLAGYLHRDALLRFATGRRLAAACGFLAVVLSLTAVFGIVLRVEWLFGSLPVAALPSFTPLPLLERAAVVLGGLAAGALFMALVPRSGSILTWLGRRSLAIYLLHPVPVIAAVWPLARWLDPAAYLLLAVFASLGICLGLGPLDRAVRRLIAVASPVPGHRQRPARTG